MFFQSRYTEGLKIHEKMLNITNHQGNANQNHNEISSHVRKLEWLLSKRQEIYVGKDVKKREPLYTLVRNVNWYSHYRKQYGVSPDNWKEDNYMI